MTRKYRKEKYNDRYENKKYKLSEKAGGVKKEKFHIENKI